MKSTEVRQAFLDYFAEQGHTLVPSSSLVPGNDPTLLFTNAGMVQFKDTFLGSESRPYNRAASSQRCVRAGGKHNDLENVGYTARHHTFFEMLGNFSFGDYFKEDAIRYAWKFLTEVLQLPEEKLWVTVHVSDDEAADIWIKDVGVSAERFSRLDEDNFWQMGDTGPCGPSSEIFYDHGEDVSGDPPGGPNDDGDRYIEIWNLVFMQYERQADGELIPLPNPSIDTGMGLERVAAVMQGVHNNYDIDLFQGLIKDASDVLGCSDLANQSLRVIADHIRSCSFLVLDDVLPSNEGRGYVLRRIIRRALRHGSKLGASEPFFHKLVASLAREMSDAYPELNAQQSRIEKALLAEEEQFARTLDKGLEVLESAISSMTGNEIPGNVVFKLHDTYGFPTDLTNDIARERGLELDMSAYEQLMAEQKDRARAANQFAADYGDKIEVEGDTQFVGYQGTSSQGKVLALFSEGEQVDILAEGSESIVVLDQTAFYAESGGQVGDRGSLKAEGIEFDVVDCTKSGSVHLHMGCLTKGSLRVGQQLTTEVSDNSRKATALNHSATHLLHAALREILGEHITQKGSLVDADRLRFDFSHSEAISAEQLKAIEDLVNTEVRNNSPVETEEMDVESAKQSGAMMLFGEKYGDRVRVLSMGSAGADNKAFSVELCGGTHVNRTGDIGLFKIVSESGIAAGVRRIEAITGSAAINHFEELEAQLDQLADLLKSDRTGLLKKAETLVAQNREIGKEVEKLRVKLANTSGSDLSEDAVEISGIKVLAKSLEGVDAKSLRDLVDQMKNKLGSGVVLLATVSDNKVAMVCGVTKDLTDQLQAGKLLAHVAEQVGGKGGGRPDMAQGGGNQPENLDSAIASFSALIESTLG